MTTTQKQTASAAAKNSAKVDRRILRTRKAIKNALDKLIIENDISKITVSAIAREADIDRKTFYLHYSSIDDLLISRAEETIEELIDTIKKHNDGDRKQHIHDTLADINNRITSNITYYEHAARFLPTDSMIKLLTASAHPAFVHMGVDEAEVYTADFRIRMHFYLAGAFSLYRYWILSDRSTPIELVSDALEDALNTDSFPVMVLRTRKDFAQA